MIELESAHATAAPAEKNPGTVVETAIVCAFSVGMIILPILEVLLRQTRGSGVPGGSVYVQHLTLWVGFVGALLATAAGKHLGLATAALLPARWRAFALVFGSMVAAATCAMLTYASFIVVKLMKQESSDTLAGGLPEWCSLAIVPLALFFITLRFIWKAPGGWRARIAAAAGTATVALLFVQLGARAELLFWPLLAAVLLAFVLGAPIFVVVAAASMLLLFRDQVPIAAVPTETLRLVQNPTLPAIPLLTLAGYVMASGKASARLSRAFKSIFGMLPGGLTLMVIGVCALFTTLTGGSGVTILAVGGVMMPALLADRYPEGFSTGLVTAAGSLGLLFFPSLPVILYGAVAGVSANKLFIGGFVPGVLLIVVVAAYSMRAGVKAHAPRQPFSLKEARAALWAAKLDLLLPVLVLATILSGWATIVEAAAVGAAYALIIELAVFRDVHPWKQMPGVLVQSATLVGAVVILMGMALGLSNVFVDKQIPEALVEWVGLHFQTQFTFLLALNGILLVLGSIFEIYAAIIVLAPLIAPLGALFKIEPVHLGVVFLANLELGFLFPPMGLNLLLSSARFGKPLPYVARHTFPFLMIMTAGVLFITYVPAITTGVVSLFGP